MAEQHICRKEKDLARLEAEMRTIKPIVTGNGKDGLNVIVPKLSGQVDSLVIAVTDLKTVVRGFLEFQMHQEGKEEGMDILRDSKARLRKRTAWVIGILITINLSLLGGMITLIITRL